MWWYFHPMTQRIHGLIIVFLLILYFMQSVTSFCDRSRWLTEIRKLFLCRADVISCLLSLSLLPYCLSLAKTQWLWWVRAGQVLQWHNFERCRLWYYCKNTSQYLCKNSALTICQKYYGFWQLQNGWLTRILLPKCINARDTMCAIQ